LRNGMALRLLETGLQGKDNDLGDWEQELGMAKARAAMMDGDLEEGIGYTGAGAGLISEILSVSRGGQGDCWRHSGPGQTSELIRFVPGRPHPPQPSRNVDA